MLRVLILMPLDSGLPVPAVKGGAIPTLIESILKVNDKRRDSDLTILTTYDKKALAKSAEYPSVKFNWLHPSPLLVWMDALFFKKKKYLQKLYAIFKVRKFLEKNDFDAIVVQNVGYLLKVFKDRSLKNKFDGKILYHLHNDIPQNADKEVLERIKFIVISNYLIQGIKNYCGEDVSHRTRIVKNGICTAKFNNELSEDESIAIKKKYGIENDCPIILFVGRIAKEKGIEELLDAIPLLSHKAILLVTGATNFGVKNVSEFEKKIHEKCRGLGDRVRFTGFIHNDDLWKLYNIADIAVLPSTWNEPAGLTMIEACVSGTPLITTNKGGIPEYIQSESAICLDVDENFVSTLAENIDSMLDNLEEYKTLAISSAPIVAEKFNEELFYDSFIKGIKDLVSYRK